MTNPSNCPACGNVLKPEDRFCPACGKGVVAMVQAPPPIPPAPTPPAVPPPPPGSYSQMPPVSTPPPMNSATVPPPPAAPPGEQVISVIGMVTKKTGLFSSELYHLVITNQRLIFALQTKEMQTQDVKNARDQAKQQGKGFFGQVGAQMGTRSGEKYLPMPPHLILAETAQNFAINLPEVVKISVYRTDFEDNSPDTLEIKTINQNMKFLISNAYNVEKQLKAVLGSKVH